MPRTSPSSRWIAQPLVVEGARCRVVSLPARQSAGAGEHLGAGRRRFAVRRRRDEQRREPGAALAEVAAVVPEPPDRAGQLQAGQRIAPGRRRPRHRGAQVVVLGVEASDPRLLVRAGQLGLRQLRQPEEEAQVAVLPARFLAALAQPVARILAHGLEQPVAGLAGAFVGLHEALVVEGGEEAEHGRFVDGGAAADLLGRVQRPAAGKDGQPAQQGLLGRRRAGRSSSRSAPAASAGAAGPCSIRRSAGGSARRAAR